MKEYKFGQEVIKVFESRNVEEIRKNIEEIFINNKRLPKNKSAKILIKPNFNNDLNALTGNSTDLRIIVSVIISLKKRGYKNITIADGPNCGINHIGIDVFSRLRINEIAKLYKVKLLNFNRDSSRTVNLVSGPAEIADSLFNSDFIINLPKLKTHVEAGITVSCKNLMGCFKGEEKRKMHDDLAKNIVRLNEIVKTDLIIVDGLIGMEGRGPGDGTPKEAGVIISGKNPYLMDMFCCRLMGLDYKRAHFLKIAIDKKKIKKEDIEKISAIKPIAKFKPATKSLFDKILLNNFFIGIRFSKPFERFFNKGFLPWILFKLKVKQDKYILEDRDIRRLYSKAKTQEEKEQLKRCLEKYCPMGHENINEDCIKCMYCYQIMPNMIGVDGTLGDFEMPMSRFGKYTKKFK